MKVRMIPLHEIKPYENNTKLHPVKQLESISKSLREFGFRQPIVIDKENTIVAGHARYEAAAALGMSFVPCEIADDLTDQQIMAYRILDNEIAKLGYTDVDALNIELGKMPDFNIGEFGIELPEIESIKEGLCNEDEIPELVKEPITKLGDVWRLGDHRLMCGDSTMIDNVEKLMDGENAELVYTDPPYGINLETDYKKRYGNKKGSSESQFYGEDKGIDLKAILANCILLGSKEVFIWGADNYPDCLPRGGSWTVWDKSVSAVDGIASDFELCWSRERHHYSMIRKLWKGAKAREETGQEGSHKTRWGHPTQKPIELALYFFDKWGSKYKTVLDFFGGSGTTLIACEKTNRKCLMMEISPNYCDIIIQRWQKFTGRDAVLESTQQLYKDLSNGQVS